MADEFVMPKLGLTMEAGTIVGWLVEDGVEVQPGQPVLVIETDKVESEVAAPTSGRFHRTGMVGQEYPCGASIGWMLAEGEEPPSAGRLPAARANSVVNPNVAVGVAAGGPVDRQVAGVGSTGVATTGIGGRLLASPNAKRMAAARGIDLRTVAGTGPGGRITSEDVPEQPLAAQAGTAQPFAASAGRGVLATIAARNLAELLGIELANVASTGPDPRITREDVAAHVRALLAPTSGASIAVGDPVPALPAPLQAPSKTIPMSGMRGTIAKRMTTSLRSMAQLTLTMDVDMGGVAADRARRKGTSDGDDDGDVPSYTDYVIAATAAALVEHPLANSQIVDDGVALLPQVNIGMAVALDDGLIVPVVQDAPSLTLEELAAATSRLASAARNGKLTLPELEGGTFSVTALGMFDVDGFTPIINAPNTAILGVGRLRDDLAWTDDGAPKKAQRLTLSLTWDHRAFDGAPAAEFTRTIKAKLEAFQ